VLGKSPCIAGIVCADAINTSDGQPCDADKNCWPARVGCGETTRDPIDCKPPQCYPGGGGFGRTLTVLISITSMARTVVPYPSITDAIPLRDAMGCKPPQCYPGGTGFGRTLTVLVSITWPILGRMCRANSLTSPGAICQPNKTPRIPGCSSRMLSNCRGDPLGPLSLQAMLSFARVEYGRRLRGQSPQAATGTVITSLLRAQTRIPAPRTQSRFV
jgi:hypothetical protein